MRSPIGSPLGEWGIAALRRRLGGGPAFTRLLHTHLLSSAADALFAVSLAGSLFFNVSIDAARPRIVLTLLLTIAPFAIVAAGIGPAIDRIRGGHRIVLALTLLSRAGVAFVLAGDLRSLRFYPEAFAILVLGKGYSVAKSAVVPRLVDDETHLVAANSRLSRLGAIASAAAGGTGFALLATVGASTLLRAAAVIWVLGTLGALRLPPPHRAPTVVRSLEYQELHGRRLVVALTSMATFRAAVGYLTFLLALALKRSGEPTGFFIAVGAAGGIGAFVGTFVAPRLRMRFDEARIIAGALAVAAAVATVGVVLVGRPVYLVVALAVGLSANTARQAFDALVQTAAPDADRARAFARFETYFQLAWAAGAVLPVATLVRGRPGFAPLAVVLGVIAVGQYRSATAVDARGAEHGAATTMIGVRYLALAEEQVGVGAYAEAVIAAHTAVDVATEQLVHVLDPGSDPFEMGLDDQEVAARFEGPLRDGLGWSPLDEAALRRSWFELDGLRREAVVGDREITAGDAGAAVGAAGALIAELCRHSPKPSAIPLRDEGRSGPV